jgi:hypothetical protein
LTDVSDTFSPPPALAELAHEYQAAVGRDARTLEIDLEGSVEGELKGLFLAFTHWVSASERS